ncbi:MAG: hypothetical protein KatS3mg125_1357 [Lysobacterales bacterium]|jgi:hypothetical protein|nr:MAG: hypothetical protein KatS3mg125_1357 [Xanthomonadales bacterium]
MATVPVEIPGYRVVRLLGQGGMAAVYLAIQESLDREVALKVLVPGLAADQSFCERFLKEGKITAKLQHPNLVTVHDIGHYGPTYYLAAEYIPGGSLRERLAAGPLPVAEALRIAIEIARGLDYAHSKQFVHRDVKPANILFRADGSAVLADFGIAKALDSTTQSTLVGTAIGTPHYMSPEQARGEPVDGRSDLYSLGVVLFEMLTGRVPYDASDAFTVALMHVSQPVPRLPGRIGWLNPLIEGLMAKERDRRFATASDFVAAVESLLESAPEAIAVREAWRSGSRGAASRPLPPAATSSVGWSGRHRWAWALVALAGLALLAAWIFVFERRPSKELRYAELEIAETAAPDPAAGGTERVPADVPALLARARALAQVGLGSDQPGRGLTMPPGESAVDLYRAVLRLEPNHAEAREGLAAIADFYRRRAMIALERGLYPFARELAEEGLKAEPENRELLQIRSRAEDMLSRQGG